MPLPSVNAGAGLQKVRAVTADDQLSRCGHRLGSGRKGDDQPVGSSAAVEGSGTGDLVAGAIEKRRTKEL